MRTVTAAVRALLLAWLLVLGAAVPDAWAQTGAAPIEAEEDAGPPDYKAWERTATRAEAMTQDRNTSNDALSTMRGYVVEWRATFQSAQNVNQARIATLKGQIDALGPAPAEGQMEAEEIAVRRTELNDQLARLQAPVIAADEAYRRADGLTKEIDRLLRERQADELMQVWPMPINPANWPPGAIALTDTALRIWGETNAQWERASAREEFTENLPLIVLYASIGLALVWRGLWLMEQAAAALRSHASARWHRVWALVISLGQVVLPTIGLTLISSALVLSSMLGPIGLQLAGVLPSVGFAIFASIWLGGRVFPKVERPDMPLNLSPEKRAEGRFYAAAFGLLLALEAIRETVVRTTGAGNDANAVLSFPVLVLGALILVRIGLLLRGHARNEAAPGEQATFRNRLVGFVGLGAIVIGIVGPLLGAVGYVAAAGALVYPAAMSLGLLGLIFVLQDLFDNLYALVVRQEERLTDALVPTLAGFALTLASLPVFALIWGARTSDISELWQKFLAGFAIGETQISPRAFLMFALIFAMGYMVTRLIQGALRSSLLPKTKLDQGGKNAILAGIGYLGVFLSGLIAINAAGINLAGLAVVAGALSLGIGFGLQNIVSNFVSGLILLIERPVSEGDWIEVGGVQGTVQAISVRSTRIQTFDRTDVIVPNTDLIAGRVTNWTRFNLTGRLIVPVAVAYGAETRKVERILREIAEAQPLVVMNPPPAILFIGFTPDAMSFEIRVILRDVNFQVNVRSDINHAIMERFQAEGVALSLSMAAQAQGVVVLPADDEDAPGLVPRKEKG
jgi:small-conductance mechanosensitive channel